jgi:acyl-CoA dehydrogenase
MSLDFDSARLRDPCLTEEHEAWREQLRRFIDREISPYVDEWDEQGFLPDDLWNKAAEFGLLGLGYPEEYGGTEEGIDNYNLNIVSEELSRTSLGGLPSTLLSHGIGLPPVVSFGSDELKAELIPPILAGYKEYESVQRCEVVTRDQIVSARAVQCNLSSIPADRVSMFPGHPV